MAEYVVETTLKFTQITSDKPKTKEEAKKEVRKTFLEEFGLEPIDKEMKVFKKGSKGLVERFIYRLIK